MSRKVQLGDSITGDRIAGEAMKILSVVREKKKGVDRTSLKKDAYCVVEVPLAIFKPSDFPDGASHTLSSEELQAFKISGTAQYISEPEVFRRSGSHRGSRVQFRGNAYCVIDQPMKFIQERQDET